MREQHLHETLQDAHTPAAIRARIGRTGNRSYLSDAVLGAIDGCVSIWAYSMRML